VAVVSAFHGVRYRSDRVGGMGAVVAPPWDVISDAERSEFCSRSPYNVVNLTLPVADGGEDRFEKSGRLLGEWRREGVLAADERPSMYLYRHGFEWEGQRYGRTGLIFALKLREGDVRGHEKTRAQAKEDRTRLLSVTRCVFGPIFMLCPDPEGDFAGLMAEEGKREDFCIEMNGESHSFAAIDDEGFHEQVRGMLEARMLIIADGHHRFGASMENLRTAVGRGEVPGWRGRTMVYCVSVKDPGVIVLPSHRMLKGLPRPSATYVEDLKKMARVEAVPSLQELQVRMEKGKGVRAGMSTGEENGLYLVTMERDLGNGGGLAYDVEYLHERVLAPLLEGVSGVDVDFTQSAAQAIEMTRSGERDMCFLVRGVEPQDVVDTAAKGRFMPSKSTYFYPKPLTGLVLMTEG